MTAGGILERFPWLKYIVSAGSAGAGITVVVVIVQAIERHPEFMPQLLSGGFLSFTALVIAMIVFDRRVGAFVEMHARSTAAQEALAANVGLLVAKDDTRAQAEEAAIRYLAQDVREILELVKKEKGAGLGG
jgi:hypothetical protein